MELNPYQSPRNDAEQSPEHTVAGLTAPKRLTAWLMSLLIWCAGFWIGLRFRTKPRREPDERL